jgi:hypothetical protein
MVRAEFDESRGWYKLFEGSQRERDSALCRLWTEFRTGAR